MVIPVSHWCSHVVNAFRIAFRSPSFSSMTYSLWTAVLDIQNMTCALCPVTVKKSLEKVVGVSQAQIDFAKKSATVTYDADKIDAPTLVKATTAAGFPSTVRK